MKEQEMSPDSYCKKHPALPKKMAERRLSSVCSVEEFILERKQKHHEMLIIKNVRPFLRFSSPICEINLLRIKNPTGLSRSSFATSDFVNKNRTHAFSMK